MTEAQLAEHLRAHTRRGASLGGTRNRLPNFMTGGETPAGHSRTGYAGREKVRGAQTAPRTSTGDGEELQSCSMILKEGEGLYLFTKLVIHWSTVTITAAERHGTPLLETQRLSWLTAHQRMKQHHNICMAVFSHCGGHYWRPMSKTCLASNLVIDLLHIHFGSENSVLAARLKCRLAA